MRTFALGFLIVCALAASGTLIADQLTHHVLWGASRAWIAFILMLWPTLGAFLAASLIEWHRPRRLFQPLRGRWMPRLARGLLAGILAVLIYTAAIPFADAHIRAEIILAAAGFLAAAPALLTSPRAKPGACIRCGYDLRESMAQDRCPECGEGIHASLSPPRERVPSPRGG